MHSARFVIKSEGGKKIRASKLFLTFLYVLTTKLLICELRIMAYNYAISCQHILIILYILLLYVTHCIVNSQS